MNNFIKKLIKQGYLPKNYSRIKISDNDYERLTDSLRTFPRKSISPQKIINYKEVIIKIIKYQDENFKEYKSDLVYYTLINYFGAQFTYSFEQGTPKKVLFELLKLFIESSCLYVEHIEIKEQFIDKIIEKINFSLGLIVDYIYYNDEVKELNDKDIYIFSSTLNTRLKNILKKININIKEVLTHCFLYSVISSFNYLDTEKFEIINSQWEKNPDFIPKKIIINYCLNPAKYFQHKLVVGVEEINREIEILIRLKDIFIIEKEGESKFYYTLGSLVAYKFKLLTSSSNFEEKYSLFDKLSKYLSNIEKKISILKYKDLLHKQLVFFNLLMYLNNIRRLAIRNNLKIQDIFRYTRFNIPKVEEQLKLFQNNKKTENILIIMKLCHLYARSYFTKENYQELQELKLKAIKSEISSKLFNLIEFKFKAHYLSKTGLNIFTDDFIMLCHDKFKEIITKTEIEREEVPVLSSDLLERIKNGENNKTEFKASFFFDVKKYIHTKNVTSGFKKSTYGYFIEPIVSFLNTNGGILFIGICENDKIKSENIDINVEKYGNLSFVDTYTKDVSLKNALSDDDFILKVQDCINTHLDPKPYEFNDSISIYLSSFKKIKICYLIIPKGKTYYWLKSAEGNDKFYVRDFNGKKELKGSEINNYLKYNPRN